MIRQLAILAIAAICLTTGNAAVVKREVSEEQKAVYKFLQHIYENTKLDEEISKLGKDYDFETKIKTFDSNYKEIVEEFLKWHKKGMLPRGHLYSLFHPKHAEGMIKLFRVFYYAPDAYELIAVAFWARNNVNEYQFFFALDLAILHRADTQHIGRRHPYRILPEFFFNGDVMKKVYDIKMRLATTSEKVENNTFIVMGNYSDSYITDTTDNEYKLTYFTEDIRINEWYYSTNLKFPFWMSSEEFKHILAEKRGRFYYYTHRWLVNRFKMERLSNDLADLEFLDWNNPAVLGYFPQMNYPNGMQFPHREEWTKAPLRMRKYINELRDYESRITAVADSGFVMRKNGTLGSTHVGNDNGFGVFNDLIQGSEDSWNLDYYGSIHRLGRIAFGSSPHPPHPYQIRPSALECDITAMRDPAFYRFYSKIDYYNYKYLKRLRRYTREELAFEGLKINSVSLTGKNIFTHFEWVDTPIDTVWRGDEEEPSVIKVRQYRLNTKPFTYKLNITSDKNVKASIRLFLGPKYNGFGKNITDKYENFYEIDYFVRSLKKGENNVNRKSIVNHFAVPYDETLEPLLLVTGDEPIVVHKKRHSYPIHLLFPKGKVGGMPVEFFVYVREFDGADTVQKLDTYANLRDSKPLGYPLNVPIYDFDMPNMYFFTVDIVHDEKIPPEP